MKKSNFNLMLMMGLGLAVSATAADVRKPVSAADLQKILQEAQLKKFKCGTPQAEPVCRKLEIVNSKSK